MFDWRRFGEDLGVWQQVDEDDELAVAVWGCGAAYLSLAEVFELRDHLNAVLIGRARPALAAPTICCDMHNQHCEPPADLCCRNCTEAAHDTFPIRHADGTPCVMDRPTSTTGETP